LGERTVGEEVLRAAFERSADSALIVDATGIVLAANRAVRGLLGRELDGLDVGELSSSHSTTIMTDVKTAASGGSIVVRLHDGAGKSRRFSCRVAALPLEGRPMCSYLITFGGEQPLSHAFEKLNTALRASRERQALERRRRLESESRLQRLEQFSGHAAHDLKAPLMQIELVLSFLEEDCGGRLPEGGADLLERARRSSRRLRRLIGDLLDRAMADDAELVREPLSLETVVDGVLEDLDPLVAKAGAAVALERPLGVVESDGVLLRQVLYNLLSNAIKYRDEERPLSVRIASGTASDGALELLVRDNGQGFDEALAEKIFEPFVRACGAEIEGSGIGLNTCRKICRRLGHDIVASGRPGIGAEFRIRFGNADRADASPGAPPSRAT